MTLLIFAYCILPRILSFIATKQIERLGGKNVELSLGRPGLKQAVAKRIHLELDRPLKSTIDIDHLTLNYQIFDNSVPRLRELKIEQAKLHIEKPESNKQIGETTEKTSIASTLNFSNPIQIINIVDLDFSFVVGKNSFLASGIKIHLQQQANGLLDGQIFAPRVKIQFNSFEIPQSSLQASFKLGQNSQADFRIYSLENSLKLTASVQFSTKEKLGELEWTLDPLDTQHLIPFFSTALSKQQLIINSGSLKASGHGQFNDSQLLSLPLKIALTELTGSLKGFPIEKLSLDFQSNNVLNPFEENNFQLSSKSLNIGIPIGEIASEGELAFTKDFSLKEIQFTSLSAKLLGGTAKSEHFTLFLGSAPKSKFTVELDNINLKEIFALYPQKEISGNGILQASVPILIRDSKVSVEGGKLKAKKTGRIRYESKAIMDINEQLKLVLKTLEDFHYRLLKSEFNYEKSGDLKMLVTLHGKNPKENQGREVHFNINLQENIPALLKSLRLAKGLSSEFDEEMAKKLISNSK